MRRLSSLLLLVLASTAAMALDINALWDYGKPELSERRFRDALEAASPDERLLLQTQIARTFGLRRDFATARSVLQAIEPELAQASVEVRVRYFLELGRSYDSAAHIESDRTPENTETAKRNFLQAYELASQARLDFLAIDALHMMPVVEPDPDRQLEWDKRAVAYMEHSTQSEARKWEGALRNNIGHALRLKGRYDEALQQFRLSRAAHERAGRVGSVRIADWMIARTLRAQKKYEQALAIQLRLERAWDADGEPDPYVYEELEHLYRALGDEARARRYGAKLKARKQ